MIKFYPSSASFSLGAENNADFPSQCHRTLFLGAHDIRKFDDISPISKAIGEDFERFVYGKLSAEFDTNAIAKERGLCLVSTPEGWFANGRCDYLITLEDGSRLAIECKGTKSSATAADFRAGRIKLYHLSQLLIYMAVAGASAGRLYCGVYNKNGDVSYYRYYAIGLEDDGKIAIDGAPFHYSLQEVFNTFDVVAEKYYEGTVPDRPVHYNDTWKSPCVRCDFNSACDNYEDKGDTALFLNECATISAKGPEK